LFAFANSATVIRHGLVSARRPAATTLFHGQEQNSVAGPVVSQRQCVKLREPAPHLLCCHPSSTICIFVITNHQPLFYICITLPVESAPFFIPSTSFCSLSWFNSSCTYHLITVITFALTIYHCSTFHSRLKTHLFHKSLPQQSLLFLPGCLHGSQPVSIKGALALFVLVSGFVCYRLS